MLKVHGRCNLACTYCYLYRGPDTTWRDRPARVAPGTMRQAAERIAEHAAAHRLPSARVDLHGGEPLLGGPGTALEYVKTVRAAVRRAAPGCALRFFVQTNGTLLTAATLRRLAAAGVRVGISADGGTAALNHRRVDHAGRPSWPAVDRAARLLAEQVPEAYAGILCTVDVAQDPLETYTSLLALRPPALDLLLPHANWDAPPPALPAPGEPGRTARATPYGDWLVRVFDRWWDAGRLETRVRLFEEILALLLGAPSAVESLGHSPGAAVLVETDGSIERVDSLRSAYHGASATGFDVFHDAFTTVREHFGAGTDPPRTCRRCPVFRVCGGGNPTHRYAPATGFRNPSVYCADLERLIRHVADRLGRAAAPEEAGPPGPSRPDGNGVSGHPIPLW
ncbi:radical SAM protein [Streptomyces sp. HNM0574]|uniref:radical SAM protein n=1 Tax=Streptomyces sp. HNM0574 TaxID=2714954 RepID=UPI0032179ED0